MFCFSKSFFVVLIICFKSKSHGSVLVQMNKYVLTYREYVYVYLSNNCKREIDAETNAQQNQLPSAACLLLPGVHQLILLQ